MSEHNLLLLYDKTQCPKRKHKGKISVAESDMRWCSDGFELGCDNGEKLRVTFALDWIATNGGYISKIVMDVIVNSISKRF